jgi:hypothetical protein
MEMLTNLVDDDRDKAANDNATTTAGNLPI